MNQRIGLFVGSFDPVHEGHSAFVLEAIRQLRLDKVLVIPEEKPRNKTGLSDLEHRMNMLQIVFGQPEVQVVALQTPNASFPQTYEELGLKNSVHLLIGSDVAFSLKTWGRLHEMLKHTILVIGVRDQADVKRLHTLMAHLEIPKETYKVILTSFESHSSSVSKKTFQFHPKIRDYIQKHHLYTV